MSTPLKRTVGLPGAVLLGLGSIVGTGVFVSLALAAGTTGPSFVLALCVAGLLAALNGVSSAQLAAAHPVSGGTYEYGYRTTGPLTGFTAGWMFLSAKSASAATAALGLAGYTVRLAGLEAGWRVPLAFVAVWAVTGLVLAGLKRSNTVNAALVGLTFAVLLAFVVRGVPAVRAESFEPFFTNGPLGFLEACALLFVAFTGYGRIATLGEEVTEPARTIPRAIGLTLIVVVALYVAVGATAVGIAGADGFAEGARAAAPLEAIAQQVGGTGWAAMITVGAVSAMAGVLLNLVLGLSRVLLAMARRSDMPAVFARIDASGTTPGPAVLGIGALISALTLLGDVHTTWSFSAFTVLVYYALTNLCAIRLEERRFSALWSWAGLVGCLGLAFWVDSSAWLAGLALLAVGHGVRALARR
ncbi:MAG: APC family permease [Myxococcota bacterium]